MKLKLLIRRIKRSVESATKSLYIFKMCCLFFLCTCLTIDGYVYAKCYKDVRHKLNEAKANIDINKSDRTSHLFSDWSEKWLEHKSLSVKQSTYIRYKNSLDSHINPKLGSYKIHLIDTERLQQFFIEESDSGRLDQSGGLSSKTLSEMLMIIKGILNFAKSHGESINVIIPK